MSVLHTAVYHFPSGINTHFAPSMGRQRMSRAPGGHSSHGSSAVISQYSGNIRHSYPIIIAVSTLSGEHIPGIGRQLRSSGRCITLAHIRIFPQRIKTLIRRFLCLEAGFEFFITKSTAIFISFDVTLAPDLST